MERLYRKGESFASVSFASENAYLCTSLRWGRGFALFCVVAVLLAVAVPATAYAGDGATIVLKSGTIVYISNGYSQLARGMEEMNDKGAENYNVELKIENSTSYINAGEVAILCRDRCNSLEIVRPKKEDRR